MKIFAAFVLFTLAIEVIVSDLYSSAYTGAPALMVFYIGMGIYAHGRGYTALRLFSPSPRVLTFCAIMLVTTVICGAMALITGAVSMMVNHGLVTSWLSVVYNSAYDGYAAITILLTAAELLTIFIRRGAGGGSRLRHYFADALGSVYAVPRMVRLRRIDTEAA